ncbi:hypothetical protein NFI96_020259 [Prochilodus magdalenae]|nr:hypothetical protein NFI96_020259 [Prochilodus magdalenae]
MEARNGEGFRERAIEVQRRDGRTANDDDSLDWCLTLGHLFSSSNGMPLQLSSVHRPVDFPPWCEVRVESPTCKLTLVLASDPRLPCIPGEGNSVDPSHGAMNMKLAG